MADQPHERPGRPGRPGRPYATVAQSLLEQRYARGDTDAFWELWVRHVDHFTWTAQRSCFGVQDHADEGLDESQDRLRQRFARYDPVRSRWNTWATRVLVNTIIDQARKRGRLPDRVMVDDDLPAPAVEEPVEPFPAGPFRADLAECFNGLSEYDRLLLVLTVFLGYNQRAAGQVVGKSDAWVSRNLPKAKKQLRACLAAKDWR